MSSTATAKRKKSPAASPLAEGTTSGVLRFGATEVKVSNLQKVLYPKAGFTKGEMIAYYLGMADYLLPHLKGRKLTRQDPGGRSGRNRGQGGALLRLEAHLPQTGEEAAVDLIGLRLQKPRQSLKMKAELVA